MVENPGAALHADAVKPVNTPEPVRVEEDASGEPLAVRLPRRHRIAAIEDKWRIDDEWWRKEPVSRLYYAVMLAVGQRLVLYKDLVSGEWYRQAL
jgi:hypothetical protein